jgi:lysozyme
MPSPKQIDTNGLLLLERLEGYSNTAYPDSGGIWTIGYGTIKVAGQPIVKGMTCTRDQAEQWIRTDLVWCVEAINELVKVPLTQNQFDALVLFVYNIGKANFANSTVLRTLNAGQPVTQQMWTAWNKVTFKGQKVEVPGLTRRRLAEYQLFKTP